MFCCTNEISQKTSQEMVNDKAKENYIKMMVSYLYDDSERKHHVIEEDIYNSNNNYDSIIIDREHVKYSHTQSVLPSFLSCENLLQEK